MMNRGKAWATVAFLLGVGVSVAANVAHTYHPGAEVLAAAHKTADQWRPELGAQAMAAFYPLALLLVVEILARAPWPHSFGWSAARYGGASVVAGVAAVVSYRHMAGLLHAYGEDALTAAIGPLAVDGLMVVASFALLAIGKAKASEPVAERAEDPAPFQAASPTATTGMLPPPSGRSQTGGEARVDGWRPVDRPVWWPPFAAAQADGQPAEAAPEAGVPEMDAGVPDVPGPYLEAAEVFAEDLQRGRVPGIRRIKQELRVGQDRAKEVRQQLAVLVDQ